jgi:hypothetical protein
MGNRGSARRTARATSRARLAWYVGAFTVAALASVTSAPVAAGADATILGRALVVAGDFLENARTVTMTARESPTDLATIVDPRASGATLTVVVAGGTPSTQSFTLDAGGWAAVPNGYRYRMPKTSSGPPVRRVKLTVEPGGAAKMTVVLRGDTGTDPLLVVPPNQGTEGGVALAIGSARYCVRFGGPAGGTIRSDKATRWRIVQPVTEAGCLAPPPPLCGNGTVNNGETCDGSASPACDILGKGVTCGAPDSAMPCDCCFPSGTSYVDPAVAGDQCCDGVGFQTAQFEFYCGACLPDLSTCAHGASACCSGTCFEVAFPPYQLCGSCLAAGTPCIREFPELCCSGSCGTNDLCD